jgi:hypothetical protein
VLLISTLFLETFQFSKIKIVQSFPELENSKLQLQKKNQLKNFPTQKNCLSKFSKKWLIGSKILKKLFFLDIHTPSFSSKEAYLYHTIG